MKFLKKWSISVRNKRNNRFTIFLKFKKRRLMKILWRVDVEFLRKVTVFEWWLCKLRRSLSLGPTILSKEPELNLFYRWKWFTKYLWWTIRKRKLYPTLQAAELKTLRLFSDLLQHKECLNTTQIYPMTLRCHYSTFLRFSVEFWAVNFPEES